MTIFFACFAVGFIAAVAWVIIRTPPPITVPSHLPGYRDLHDSPEWRAQKARLIHTRADGHCEHGWCRSRRNLQAHLLTYDCLYENRRPYDDEIMILCTPKHHGRADRARRRRERTRRERRRVARLAAR